MSNEIIKILDDLAQRFGIMIDWTQDNVMPYLTELFDRVVLYRISILSIWLFIGLATLLSVIVIHRKLYKKSIKDYKTYLEIRRAKNSDAEYDKTYLEFVDMEYGELAYIHMGLLLIGIIGLACIIINIFNLTEILLLPEMYVIEFVSRLM